MKKYSFRMLFLAILILLCSACQSAAPAENGASAQPVAEEPVTLNLFIDNPAMTEEKFNNLIAGPLKKKYPHISFKITTGTKDLKFSDLLTSGDTPDLVYTPLYIQNYLDTDYALDLTDAIKKHNIDLSKVYPEVINSIKKFGNGKMYQFPWMNQSFALFYNKDVFDRFGVSYPHDGMTWQETIDLAKKVTRMSDGTQYYGLGFNGGLYPSVQIFGNPLSIQVWDSKNEKGIVSDDWKMPMETLMSYFGKSEYRLCKECKGYYDLFLAGQVAMWPYWTTAYMGELEKRGANINWDVVQEPSFTQTKDKYYQTDYHGWVVSKTTKHLDAVMEFLEVTLSEEVQKAAAKSGIEPVVKDYASSYLSDAAFAKGKNIASIYKSQPAPLVDQSLYNFDVLNSINDAFKKVIDGQTDVNTALRTAQEDADKRIQARKAAK